MKEVFLMKNIVIIGAGGLAREVQHVIEKINFKKKQWNLIGFIDENPQNKGKLLNDDVVIGNFDDLPAEIIDQKLYYICAIGNTKVKKRLVQKANEKKLEPAILVDPDIYISKSVFIGEGSVIYGNTNLTANIQIGNHVIINPGCTIGHDVVIEDFKRKISEQMRFSSANLSLVYKNPDVFAISLSAMALEMADSHISRVAVL